MKTWATIVAACMSAVLYFNRPIDEPTPEPVVAATCYGDDCDCCDCDIDALIARMEAVEAKLKSIEQVVEDVLIATAEAKSNIKQEPLPAPVPVTPAPSVQPSEETPEESYQSRWHNYDGKTRMQHAVDAHGIDIRGKSESQVLREMDAWHDRYGSGHPVKARPVQVVRQPQVYNTSNCPGGVCPTGTQQQVQASSGGWYLGKNLGRRR